MKLIQCFSLAFLFAVFGPLKTLAATITAISSGSWTTNGSWNCNCQPSNSDNITIPSGITITANSSPVLILGPVITININGTLVLRNANLLIDGNDIINVNSGGKISGAGFFGGTVTSGLTPIAISSGSSLNGPSIITGGALPIELLSFTGERLDKSIMLKWTSASEKNFNYYEIQRSGNGKNFQPIGAIAGSDNSLEERSYFFEDISPLAGDQYYRLKAVDLDGTSELFSMIMVHFDHEKCAVIFPNPVHDQNLKVSFNFEPQGNSELFVYDSRGYLVMKKSLSTSNLQEVQLPAEIGKGVYIVVLKTKGLNHQATIKVD